MRVPSGGCRPKAPGNCNGARFAAGAAGAEAGIGFCPSVKLGIGGGEGEWIVVCCFEHHDHRPTNDGDAVGVLFVDRLRSQRQRNADFNFIAGIPRSIDRRPTAGFAFHFGGVAVEFDRDVAGPQRDAEFERELRRIGNFECERCGFGSGVAGFLNELHVATAGSLPCDFRWDEQIDIQRRSVPVVNDVVVVGDCLDVRARAASPGIPVVNFHGAGQAIIGVVEIPARAA